MTKIELHNGRMAWEVQKKHFLKTNGEAFVSGIEKMIATMGADWLLSLETTKDICDKMSEQAKELFVLSIKYLEYTSNQYPKS